MPANSSTRNPIQGLLSVLLISVGIMTTMTFGFVPQLNLLSTYLHELYAGVYWFPFGLSCLIFGSFLDRVKQKKYLCFSFVAWGVLVLVLNFVVTNPLLVFILIVGIAILTGINVIVGTSYMSSKVQIERRALHAGIFLGIGWALVSVTAYLSYVDLHLNLILLGSANIGVGVVSFFLIQSGRVERWETWSPPVHIPKDFDVRTNSLVFWESSLVFGVFLGVIVFLLGTQLSIGESPESFYLTNVLYYYDFTVEVGLPLANFDFLVVGALSAILSPVVGRLMDKFGRKHIFFIGNLCIPACIIGFAFWDAFAIMGVSVLLYSVAVTVFVLINCTVWSDLASERRMAKFNGYGFSSVGVGGTIGYYVGATITNPSFLNVIDKMVVMTIVVLMLLALIPFVSMKDSLPPAEEMSWPSEIEQLYVITQSGMVMTYMSFAGVPNEPGPEAGEMLDKAASPTPAASAPAPGADPTLFSGGISGISAILHEMVQSEAKLKIIDHEDKKILFEYGTNFVVTLVSKKNLRILRTKLQALAGEIERVFWEVLQDWDGNLNVFKPVKTMIRHHFVEA